MVEGLTGSGFSFCITDQALDNMELLDALTELGDDDAAALSRVCLLLLGKDQRRRLYDHLRREDGGVPVAAVTEEITEILNYDAAGKNSEPSPE